jgi:hypothetical protein
MTRQQRDNAIYEWITLLDEKGDPDGEVRVLKPNIRWSNYLLPSEERYFNSLSEVEQLQISLCMDPINALNSKMRFSK